VPEINVIVQIFCLNGQIGRYVTAYKMTLRKNSRASVFTSWNKL